MTTKLEQLMDDAESSQRQKNFDAASKNYLQALELEPQSASALYGLGVCYMQLGRNHEAKEQFARARELEPEAVDIAINYATCAVRLGDHRAALLELQRATQYCRDDPVFCPAIAKMLVSLGEYKGAIEILARLAALAPDDQILLARAKGLSGDWQEAVAMLFRLSEEVPDNAQVANELATAAGNLRDYPIAIMAFERYLKSSNPSGYDYLRFADLLMIAKHAKRSEQALSLAADQGEDSAELYALRARLARLNGDYPSAIAASEEAIQRVPQHGHAWSLLSELSDDEQVEGLIEQLSPVINSLAVEQKVNQHYAGLLFYSLAHLYERNQNFELAAQNLKNANMLKFQYLQAKGQLYQPEQIEKDTARTIKRYRNEVFELPSAQPDADQASLMPIFIVGMPRSGTTLVEKLLGQHDSVSTSGELEAMQFVAAEYNKQIGFGRLPEPDEMSVTQWQGLRQAYLNKAPENRKAIFTDKLPHNFQHVGLILKLFPEARIIQIQRAREDVLLSVYSHPFADGHAYACEIDSIRHQTEESERLMAHWSSIHSPQILDLKYENLVNEPEHYAEQLFKFCGLGWKPEYLDFHKKVAQSFTFSELQVRKAISTDRIGRWQHYQPFFEDVVDT